MKEQIREEIRKSLLLIAQEEDIDSSIVENVEIDRCKDLSHGDFSSNAAMKYAKKFAKKPFELAQLIKNRLGKIEGIQDIEIAGAGFLNIRLNQASTNSVLLDILNQKDNFGIWKQDNSQKILLEFVSANPTGPLHVGHGRGAAYGASLANVLKACGQEVDCEYYVNDAGRQMDILALSLYWRYAQKCGDSAELPKGIYQGDYVSEVAEQFKKEQGSDLYHPLADFIPTYPQVWSQEEIDSGARDKWIDAAIVALKSKLQDDYEKVFNAALVSQLSDIRNDLTEFGVQFDNWYSEKSLFTHGKIQQVIEKLDQAGYLYEKDGALWFKARDFGDEKDRVVRRENGISTYFASDIAYHLDKYARNYDKMIDIFGADHHGYMARVRASLAALDLDPNKLEIALVQFAVLYQNGQKVQMSTRSGEFVTLRELRKIVGSDAARFFYVMRKPEQHMDFDLDLAVSNSKDNPYYYVQYAHARCCRVLEKAQEENQSFDATNIEQSLLELKLPEEIEIISKLSAYPDVVKNAGEQFAPHLISLYLRELAALWHHYYDAGHKVLINNDNLRNARLCLTICTAQVLKNALHIIGVKEQERM